MNYFNQTGFVSNSDLGTLKRAMNGINEEAFKGKLKNAYQFGTLFDAMLTEEKEAEKLKVAVNIEMLELAENMKLAADQDSTLSLFFKNTRFQHEIYRNAFAFTFEGMEETLPIRVKLDFLKKEQKTGADLKTTACTSETAFANSIITLDYDRQAALYMDAAGLDFFWIIGVSKSKNKITRKHQVFKRAIRRDDANYRQGKAKYSKLLHYYKHLIFNLNIQ